MTDEQALWAGLSGFYIFACLITWTWLWDYKFPGNRQRKHQVTWLFPLLGVYGIVVLTLTLILIAVGVLIEIPKGIWGSFKTAWFKPKAEPARHQKDVIHRVEGDGCELCRLNEKYDKLLSGPTEPTEVEKQTDFTKYENYKEVQNG